MKFNVVSYDILTSTNDEAKRLAAEGAPEGTVVRAALQTAGRGRRGRSWQGAQGECLMCSLLLRPRLPAADTSSWTLAAGLAISRALSHIATRDIRVKWPNDIVADGKKLCGILSELHMNSDEVAYIVTGFGINAGQTAFDAEISGKAVSLRQLTGRAFVLDDVLDAVLAELDAVYQQFLRNGFAALVDEYNGACVNTGASVLLSGGVAGVARGVDETGCLVVDAADGKCMRVPSGDVSVRAADGRYV